MTTFDKVYAAVRLIPRGSVATYGQIAAAIGNKRLRLSKARPDGSHRRKRRRLTPPRPA